MIFKKLERFRFGDHKKHRRCEKSSNLCANKLTRAVQFKKSFSNEPVS